MIYTLTLNPALDKTLQATGLRPDVINRAQILREDIGGKGINVSRALHNLGLDSRAMGFLGGTVGQRLRQGLGELDIAHDVVDVAGETRINLTIHDQDRDELVKLNEPGPSLDETDLARLQERVARRLQAGTSKDFWVMAGNLPPGLPEDTYARLVDQIQTAGAKVVVDTSGQALHQVWNAGPFLLKPNRAEAEYLLGYALKSSEALVRGVAELLAGGVERILLSLGAEGAIAAEREASYWARPPQVQVRSDIGAGDSLLAGFIWSLAKGQTLEEALRWAVAAGTAATQQEGTGVCTLARTQALYASVQVERLQ